MFIQESKPSTTNISVKCCEEPEKTMEKADESISSATNGDGPSNSH